jgi:uncharacterized protein DUF4129
MGGAGRPSESPSRTSPSRRPAVALALAVAAVVLVALVGTGDNVPLATEGSGGWHLTPRAQGERPVEPDSTVQPPVDPTDRSRLPGEGALAVLLQAAMILFGVTVMFLTGRALARMSRRTPEPLDLGPPEHWPEPADEMVDAVDEGLAALSTGPVDEVVVACWVRLEEAASSAGAGRGVAETPAELASRVLGELHAPPDAVDGLLERYRRARFSHHPLDETDRAVATRSLEEIRAAIAGARR